MTDYKSSYEDPAEVIDPHYSGCMNKLMVNGQHYPLTLQRGWRGWSIRDCDGTACGAEVCLLTALIWGSIYSILVKNK